MRICMYTNTALPKVGGQEIVVDALARQFLELGHEPVVLAPWRASQGKFDPRSAPYAMAWHPRFLSMRCFVAWYGRWLAKLQREKGFDVVHCHGTYPAAYVAACCDAIRQLPLIITSHGDDLAPQGLYDRKPELRDRYRVALSRADAAIAISDFTAGMYRAAYPELSKIVSIANGVDVRQFAAPAERPDDLPPAIRSGNYFLFIGRLDRRKGIDILLNAMTIVRQRSDMTLVVAGRGPEGTPLEALTARLRLAERVHFVGQACEQRKLWLLQNCRATIVPSRLWEAFGVVAIESFAAGRPVVASQLQGLADLVRPNVTGRVVPPESHLHLAEAMLTLAENEAAADRMGAAAREFVQAFDWRGIALRHLELYEELIARGRRATVVSARYRAPARAQRSIAPVLY